MLVFGSLAMVDEVAGNDSDIGRGRQLIDRGDGARQVKTGVELGIDALAAWRRCRNPRAKQLSRRQDVGIGNLGDEHQPVPESTNTPCSANRLASVPRGSSAKGRPCRSRVRLRSMRE